MVIDSLRVVLFLAGGTAAAAGAAYMTGAVDILFPKPNERTELAAVPPVANPPAEEQPAVVPTPEDPQPAEPVAADTPADAVLPAFDLVRVEPDGSLVIAGTASPASRVEVFTEAKVWGEHTSTREGDFAIVCDERLAPGDYAIKLRATTESGEVLISRQTAIVSIPSDSGGEVLAMVEEEGRPSRIITAPAAPEPVSEPVDVAEAPVPAPAEPAVPVETAEAPEEPVVEEPAEVAVAPEEPAPEEPAELAAAPEEPIVAEEPAEIVAAPEEPVAVEQPVEAAEAPEEPVVADEPAEVAAAPEQPAEADEPAEVAAAPVEAEEPVVSSPPVPVARPSVLVEAVEIEGKRVFIAGKADKGYMVRAYANDLLLGDSDVSDAGRFLVEAEQELEVGHYIMRADLIDRNAQVVARAAVPFDREPGEAVAAVTPPIEETPAPVAEAPADPAPVETVEAPKPAEPAPSEPVAVTEAPAAPAPAEPAPVEVTETPAPEAPVEVAAAPEEPVEVTQPKLQNVTGSVIIRRGDTLWRISRRVYGKGVRYTTIYVANQPQIEDPHRIWPGQVFAVPGRSDAGEEADWSAIADQMPKDEPDPATVTR